MPRVGNKELQLIFSAVIDEREKIPDAQNNDLLEKLGITPEESDAIGGLTMSLAMAYNIDPTDNAMHDLISDVLIIGMELGVTLEGSYPERTCKVRLENKK